MDEQYTPLMTALTAMKEAYRVGSEEGHKEGYKEGLEKGLSRKKWRSSSDPPHKRQEVLAVRGLLGYLDSCIPLPAYYLAYFKRGRWYDSATHNEIDVTHWQPLPDLKDMPIEGDDENA